MIPGIHSGTIECRAACIFASGFMISLGTRAQQALAMRVAEIHTILGGDFRLLPPTQTNGRISGLARDLDGIEARAHECSDVVLAVVEMVHVLSGDRHIVARLQPIYDAGHCILLRCVGTTDDECGLHLDTRAISPVIPVQRGPGPLRGHKLSVLAQHVCQYSPLLALVAGGIARSDDGDVAACTEGVGQALPDGGQGQAALLVSTIVHRKHLVMRARLQVALPAGQRAVYVEAA
eukprot:CAMPEP_0183530148 /NCGR_PEP_ID=MMETSP0371-20130417/23916_1 /TAXON_ID=268820 /ORGANISM="Peridinium aciculiferum, Strain PAER-2" /LENGTH=234 /DNA_ID=CAMNT_0025729997 /DNA_START=70 /DNA_END=774 /DNA_ORIENTATION=-